MTLLAGFLAIVVFVVVFGAPIWFSIKARPIGPLRYRWGAFVAWQYILVTMLFLRIAVTASDASLRSIAGALALIAVGTMVGLLRRRRWGVVCYVVTHFSLIMIPLLLADPDDSSVSPFPEAIAGALGLLLNCWYFAKRWKFMSVANPAVAADPVAQIEDQEPISG